MYKRYDKFSDKIKENATGTERLSSTQYPTFPYRDTDVYIFTRRSDRLDLLAYKYYGDAALWWIIARVNNLGKGSFQITPGIRIRIPFPITELFLSQFEE